MTAFGRVRVCYTFPKLISRRILSTLAIPQAGWRHVRQLQARQWRTITTATVISRTQPNHVCAHGFTGLGDVESIHCWTTADQRPGRSEQWLNALVRRQPAEHSRVVAGGSNHFLPHLCAAIAQADEIDFAVAFIKVTGLRLLLPDLLSALNADGTRSRPPARFRVVTSDYLDVTDPEALRLLMLLQAHGADVRVFEAAGSSFHMKAYLFAHFQRTHPAPRDSQAQLSSAQATLVVRRSRTVWNGTIGSTIRQILDTLRRAPDLKNYLPPRKLSRSRIVGSTNTRHVGCLHRELSPQARRKSIRHPSPPLFN
jgi:HKD family nuclease